MALERAWERYHGNVEAPVKDGVSDENRAEVLTTIKKHRADERGPAREGGSTAPAGSRATKNGPSPPGGHG